MKRNLIILILLVIFLVQLEGLNVESNDDKTPSFKERLAGVNALGSYNDLFGTIAIIASIIIMIITVIGGITGTLEDSGPNTIPPNGKLATVPWVIILLIIYFLVLLPCGPNLFMTTSIIIIYLAYFTASARHLSKRPWDLKYRNTPGNYGGSQYEINLKTRTRITKPL